MKKAVTFLLNAVFVLVIAGCSRSDKEIHSIYYSWRQQGIRNGWHYLRSGAGSTDI